MKRFLTISPREGSEPRAATSATSNTDIGGLATLENQYMYILPHNAHHLKLLMWAGI